MTIHFKHTFTSTTTVLHKTCMDMYFFLLEMSFKKWKVTEKKLVVDCKNPPHIQVFEYSTHHPTALAAGLQPASVYGESPL